MAGHSGPSFVADLRAKPWYPAYAQVFTDAGIPQWIPDSIVANEDPTLSLTAQGTDARSIGIAQINLDAHPDVTLAQAQDPVFSARYMAAQLAPIMQQNPSIADPANVAQTIALTEQAGWPGGTGVVRRTDGTFYNETPDRILDAQNVIAQEGVVPTPMAGPAPTAAQEAAAQATSGNAADPFGLQALWTSIDTAWVNGPMQSIFLGTLAIALLSGGFIWLGAVTQNQGRRGRA